MRRAKAVLIQVTVAGLTLACAVGCATPPGRGLPPAAAAVPPPLARRFVWVPGGWERQDARLAWHDGHWTKPGDGPGPVPPPKSGTGD